MILKRLGWEGMFEVLVSTDHVNHVGKPDPAIYTYTLEQLGRRPEECIVIEDAQNGIRSAQGAGLRCVVVPDPRRNFGDYSMADYQVTSLKDPALYAYLGL